MAEDHAVNESENSDLDWSVARVLAWATGDLNKRGHESARLEAELLLGEALSLDRVQLILQHQRPLTPDELARFKGLFLRRRKQEPVAYILGQREFYGLPIRVDSRVLVPRPDTETLVEVALERTSARNMYGTLLDLCTGSGCVGIAFAKHRPTWKVSLSDISAEALEVAEQNAVRLGVVRHLELLLGDLFAPLAEHRRFDLITANPPYIPGEELSTLAADIREFEPRKALDGGVDGLDVVRRVVDGAPAWLNPGGVLACEIGYDQARNVAEAFESRGFVGIERCQDYGGRERVVSGRFDG
jgi:release factor glutamine methyltransferase